MSCHRTARVLWLFFRYPTSPLTILFFPNGRKFFRFLINVPTAGIFIVSINFTEVKYLSKQKATSSTRIVDNSLVTTFSPKVPSTAPLLTVPSLYALEVCMIAKKRKMDLPKLRDNHTSCTRNRDRFRIPNHRTARFEMKPSYIGTKLFDRLPEQIKGTTGKKAFKTALKQYLLEQCSYSINELLCQ